MQLACPTCKRRFKDEDTQCRRCGTELLQIKNVIASFTSTLAEGKRLLRQDAIKAEHLLRQALKISPQSTEAKQALALALLLQKRFAEAVQYSRA